MKIKLQQIGSSEAAQMGLLLAEVDRLLKSGVTPEQIDWFIKGAKFYKTLSTKVESARMSEPIGSDVTELGISFHSGDDYVKYMATSAPNASAWCVTLRGARGGTAQAERVPVGNWLSPYHKVTLSEVAWIVDSCLLRGEKCHEIEIRVPDQDKPHIIPYPYRDYPLG